MKKVLFTIGIIAILVGVAFAAMAATSNPAPPPWTSLEGKITAVGIQVTTLDTKVTTLGTKVNNLQGNVSVMQGKLDTLQTTSDAIDGKVDTIGTDVSAIKDDVATIKSDLAKVTKMETGSGISPPSSIAPYAVASVVPERQNPQVRHVHLSYRFEHTIPDVHAYLDASIMVEGYPYMNYVDSQYDDGFYTVDFDAQCWSLGIVNGNDTTSETAAFVVYAWTETYSQ